MTKSPSVDWKVKLRVRHHSLKFHTSAEISSFSILLTFFANKNFTEISLMDGEILYT